MTRLPPFSLTLTRTPPEPLRCTGPRRTPEEYDRLAASQVKIKILERLFAFLRRAEDKSSPARRTYKKEFDKKVKNLSGFEPGDGMHL